MSDDSGYSTQDGNDLSDSDGGDLSDRSVAEDEIEDIRDGIGLLATCSAAAFEAAVIHLPSHLQNSAFRARQHLRAVSSAIDSRRIGAAVRNEMEQLLPMTAVPAQSAQAAQDSGSQLSALPRELQACVYAATWCKSISELPLACLTQICEAAWRDRDAPQVCGRLACVAHCFRVDSLLGPLAEARDEWLSCWICVTGLPACAVPEQGRRMYQLTSTLFGLQHTEALTHSGALTTGERTARDRAVLGFVSTIKWLCDRLPTCARPRHCVRVRVLAILYSGLHR